MAEVKLGYLVYEHYEDDQRLEYVCYLSRNLFRYISLVYISNSLPKRSLTLDLYIFSDEGPVKYDYQEKQEREVSNADTVYCINVRHQ